MATPKVIVYDSDFHETYIKHRRYAVSYEPMWQMIRRGLHWTAYQDALGSLAMCDAYVGRSVPSVREQLQRRVWRVYNLLCAIPHGQASPKGIRIVERSATEILVPALDRYRDRVNEVGYPTFWDWAITRANARSLWGKTPDELEANYKTLKQYRGSKSRSWSSKPELWHYLSILEEVMGID